MSVVLRRLFVTNPVLEEATRAWRKFFRVAGGPGKGMAYAAVFVIGLIYVWIIAEILMNPGDWATPILYLQLFVVTLVMPLSVYGSISGERERSTWEALILTRLTPGQIVSGKIAWRLIGLLILMAVFFAPLMFGAFWGTASYHRVAGGALFLAELMTFAWGFVLCTFGLWVSANTRHSVTSAALIFITLLAVLALLPALFSMLGGAAWDTADFAGNYPTWILMHINAFFALSKITSWFDQSATNPDLSGADPLYGMGWGMLQIVLYFVGAAVFLYVTYRSLRIWEEPKHRIG